MSENIRIRAYEAKDAGKVDFILNDFARKSFAVYNDENCKTSFAETRSSEAKVFLVLQNNDEVIGFGMVTPYRPFRTCAHTGVLTYFILPEFTGKGLGSRIINELIEQSLSKGINNFLAHISSKNDQSLAFHSKHGFEEVGRFKKIGKKFDEYFDIVWVQKEYPETVVTL
ncbi:MAG: GNAT family N-acetyltransferase [Bacteroidetes bacterium]|nr:GNAT family N-acetyltransferase [Bacteroidota bacterium]